MSNPGTALPRLEEALLDVLAARSELADVRLLDRKPQTGAELKAEGATGGLDALWFDDVDADLDAHGGHAGTVPYDEVVDFSIVIQVLRPRTAQHTMTAVKARAAAILDAVLQASALDPHLGNDDADRHSRFEFVLTGWTRRAGPTPDGRALGCRYAISAQLSARITPTAP